MVRSLTSHVWYKCDGVSCRDSHCAYCDGGLAYCVVCKKGEGELESQCPVMVANAQRVDQNQPWRHP